MKKTKKFSLASALLMFGSLVGGANAALVTFDFTGVSTDTRGVIYTSMVDGVELTVDNPNGDLAPFGRPDTLSFEFGGLTVDNVFSANLDFTFSEDVRLVGYTIVNDEIGGSFDLQSGSVESLGNTVNSNGSFVFTNTTDIFTAESAVSLTSSNNNLEGYAFGSITVDTVTATVPEPSSALLLGLGSLGFIARRRRTA